MRDFRVTVTHFFLATQEKEPLALFRFLSNLFNPTENLMQKLLNAYRANPTPANHAKLQKYLDKHMMAVCLALPEDIAFLRAHNFSI